MYKLHEKKLVFLKLLLNKYFTGKQEALSKLTPESEFNEISQQSFVSKNPTSLFFCPETVAQMHYSWLRSTLMTLPEALRSVVVASLSKDKAQNLINMEPDALHPKEANYPEKVQRFLFHILYSHFPEKEITPQELLPEYPLLMLLEHKKSDLVEMIDLLAMHDLAEEVKRIVDKNFLQAILVQLTPRQQRYLKTCLHQKSRLSIAPLQVRETYKDKKEFARLLHKRGLQRLSIALSGCHPDFLWHISHIFDIGRGKILIKLTQKEDIPGSTQGAQMQVQQVITFQKANEAP